MAVARHFLQICVGTGQARHQGSNHKEERHGKVSEVCLSDIWHFLNRECGTRVSRSLRNGPAGVIPDYWVQVPLSQAVAKLVLNQKKGVPQYWPNNVVDQLFVNQHCDLQVYHQAFEMWKH